MNHSFQHKIRKHTLTRAFANTITYAFMHIQSQTNNTSDICRGLRDKRDTVSVILPQQLLSSYEHFSGNNDVKNNNVKQCSFFMTHFNMDLRYKVFIHFKIWIDRSNHKPQIRFDGTQGRMKKYKLLKNLDVI